MLGHQQEETMAAGLTERVCDLVAAPPPLSAGDRQDVLLAFADTLACAHAGWFEPVARAVAGAWRGGTAPLLDGGFAPSAEHAALITATAGHALDYDDVHLDSTSHPSVVLVPALLAMQAEGRLPAARLAPAFAIGIAVNAALGRALGFAHYRRGWHATSTIGPLAGAAALAHLLALDRLATRQALALAAAQSGGLQRNFGAMAKPAQAGFAAAAAVRAATLAQAGLTADADVFAVGGFLDLYGGDAGATARGAAVALDARPGSIARKLYPCCYATHRLVAAALDARAPLNAPPPAEAALTLFVPAGGLQPLRDSLPRTGLEAKFSAEYTVAVAFWQGSLGLADFEDAAVARPEAAARMARVRVIEEPVPADGAQGLEHGTARLAVTLEGREIARGEAGPIPGSPARPATQAEMQAKIADCLARHAAAGGRPLAPAAFLARLEAMLAPAAAQAA
ncbi:MmgE/PrpD family protein [Paeniroseomonas aquatica]|uniref:MmgE/PrpD family protein n=1 Tax=Paeniroseomonas aquatica TaxID=373043 RepID=A0ABT8A496_9PROT|nr:MmgE/PrpD family protein [Paeniroseomonas aquatica]MDN3564516.1 MmgE/PrpD family protein [Paeniroseomonas aquatica]